MSLCACDIQNAYLQAPSSEKHYVTHGPEFGLKNVGKTAIIVRALYRGKSTGADYGRHEMEDMMNKGYELKFVHLRRGTALRWVKK